MTTDGGSLVETGVGHAHQGDWWNAALAFQRAVKADPRDLVARQRFAEALAKVGRTAESVREYGHVAGAYAARGQPLKAIAVYKLVQQLDPTHTATQEALAALIGGRDATGERTAKIPASMSAALAARTATEEPAGERGALAGAELQWNDTLDTWASQAGQLFDQVAAGSTLPPAPQHKPTPPPPPPPDVDDEIVVEDGVEVVLDVSQSPRIPLFSSLDGAALVWLLERMQPRAVRAGQVVMREGEAGHAMFVIVQGTVDVVRPGPDGRPRVLAQMGEGAFFGEMALVAGGPRMATVVAQKECVLLEISRDVVGQLVRAHPAVAQVLEHFYRERLVDNLFLSSVLFAPLGQAERAFLVQHAQTAVVEAGTALVQQDQVVDGLYVVLRGTCEAQSKTLGGATGRYPQLTEGDIFGEVSMVSSSLATATVRATSTCMVLKLPRDAFLELARARPDLWEGVARVAAARMDRSSLLAPLDVDGTTPAAW